MTRHCKVYKVRTLGALIAIFLTVGEASPQSESDLIAMLRLEGECSQLIIEGNIQACEGTVLHPLYQSGRVSLMFVSTGNLVSFTGWSGPFDGRTITIALDGVTHRSDEVSLPIPVEGQCIVENPYEGRPAGLFCEAVTPAGQKFFAEFMTDGSQPIVMIDNRK